MRLFCLSQKRRFFGSSTVCAKTRRKIEKTERRNENTVYSEKLRLTGKQRQRRWFLIHQCCYGREVFTCVTERIFKQNEVLFLWNKPSKRRFVLHFRVTFFFVFSGIDSILTQTNAITCRNFQCVKAQKAILMSGDNRKLFIMKEKDGGWCFNSSE